MRFFANKLNGEFLQNVLPAADIEIDWVRAAIAYGNDSTTLVRDCLQNGRRLDIWMRYDHTVPVAPSLLRELLSCTSRNIFCYLIPDVLHAKMIWWKNYGVYIGSANLTDRAWVSNIEFGVFLPETLLEANGGMPEIESFFEYLSTCDHRIPLDDAVIKEQEALWKLRHSTLHTLDKESEGRRRIKKWDGPILAPEPQKARARQKEIFIKEWRDGLRVLEFIAKEAPGYRPKWLNEDVPAAWQADQFLHAYYYNEVVDGVRHPYEEYHQRNIRSPAAATKGALEWWAKLDTPPSNEDVNCHIHAPTIRSIMSKENIAFLSIDGFRNICSVTHSTGDHLRRMSLDELGLVSQSGKPDQDRVEAFASLIWSKKNSKGENVGDLLRFVVDGGPADEIPSRLFDAAKQPDRKISHFGLSQLAEIAGWARPELYPPRNGRTSKSLRALGFDVRVY